jgi:hypothetical protein
MQVQKLKLVWEILVIVIMVAVGWTYFHREPAPVTAPVTIPVPVYVPPINVKPDYAKHRKHKPVDCRWAAQVRGLPIAVVIAGARAHGYTEAQIKELLVCI